ncbi:MAG TPA: hypothetical protein VJO32_01185 [Ktedonobacteraceae bacterium]|nr:hypothetical protein [Ktedonobacteraceae bacterium]
MAMALAYAHDAEALVQILSFKIIICGFLDYSKIMPGGTLVSSKLA